MYIHERRKHICGYFRITERYLLLIIETGSRVAKTGVSQENTVLYRRQVSKHSDSHMTLLKVDELFSAFFDIFSI